MGKRKDRDTSHYTWVEDHVAAASLAYDDDHISDLNDDIKLSEGWTFLKTIDGASGCRAKLWVSKENGNVLCAFRGTQSIAEAKIDADIGYEGFNTWKGEARGNIHRGFAKGFNDMKDVLDNEIRVMRDMGYLKQGTTLQFAGHSLGGALSDIASTYYGAMFPDVQIVTTTVGAPMTGDKDFQDFSRSLPNVNRTRIVSDRDPVARTPIPGMGHIEKANVLDFRTKKKGKGLMGSIVDAAKSVLGGAASTAFGHLRETAGSHSMDYYKKVLAEDFKENRVTNVNEAHERAVDANEEAYIASKKSENAAVPGTCQCDCHYHDLALEREEVPPESTGAVEQMQPVSNETMNTTASLALPKTKNTFDQTLNMTDIANKVEAEQQTQRSFAEAQSNEIMEQINTALEAEKEKERTQLQKLQDRYAQLMNQTPDDLDDIAKERATFQRDQEDIHYIQERIQLELEHPEYVREDAYNSKETAMAFKNMLNQLYSAVLSAGSQYKADLKTDKTPPDADDIERLINDDQIEQAEGARKTDTLNPDDQSSGFVFDTSKLTDLDGEGDAPETRKQLLEWMSYGQMSTRELYDVLKQDMTSQYQQKRMAFLREKEQETRKTAADKIKTQLESHSKMDGSGTYDKFSKERTAFFTSLGKDQRFQQLIRENKVNVKALLSKYQKEGDDAQIMTDLFGYDERTIQDTLAQEYQRQFQSIDTSLPLEERSKLMANVWKEYNLNKTYPWIKSGDFKATYDKYKDDPTKLTEELKKVQPNIPASYRTDPEMVMEQTGINQELLKQNVVELANNSKGVLQQEFKDYYKDFREEQLASFKDNAKVQEMFKELNPETSWVQDAAAGAKDALTLFTTRKGGWFDKEGKYLGAIASPDFEDYVRNNPDSGFKYVSEKKDETIDFIWEQGGAALGMRFGVDPAAAIDNLAGNKRDKNNDGVVTSNDYDYGGDDDEIFNPMAFLFDNDKDKDKDKPRRGKKYNRKPKPFKRTKRV